MLKSTGILGTLARIFPLAGAGRLLFALLLLGALETFVPEARAQTPDTTAPRVAIARTEGQSGPVNGAFDITITFTEAVTGFDENDLTVGNGTASNVQGSGADYTARITPTDEYNGPVTVDIGANRATDEAGNNNEAAAQFSVTADQTDPTVEIEGPTGPVNGVFDITITFTEAVTGFDEDDLTVGNGVAGDFQGSGADYTARITPAGTGEVTVDIGANRATDAAGNGNEAAPQLSVTANLTAPTVIIARPVGQSGPINGTFGITITFSDSVTGLVLTELMVGNGTASDLEGSGANYTAMITPTASYDGPVTVDIAGNVATDGMGRGNTAAVQFSVTADQTAPMVTLTGPANPIRGTFPVTVTFTEPVNDFNADDIRISNGVLRSLEGSGAVYTAMIDPIITPSLVVIVRVPADRAFDAAGNGNERVPVFLSVTIDQTAPTVAIARPNGESGPVSGTFPITVTFSEAVTGFDVDDLTVGNGMAISVMDTGDGAAYTAMIMPDAAYNGAVTVDIAANVAEDLAGNGNEAAQQLSVTADQTAPTVTIMGPSSVDGSSFPITITFSEAATGFDVDDLTVGNGTASDLQGNGAVYTATIRQRAGYTGMVTVDIAANRATDVAGNGNQAADQFSVMVTGGPTPVFIPVLPIDGTILSVFPRVFSVDITFGQFVSGHSVEMSELTVTNGTVTDLRETTPGFGWTVTVTATQGPDGPVTIKIAAGAVQDNAGRDSAPGMVTVMVDQTPPTPTITRPDGETGPVNGFFNIIIDFGESISGFRPPTVANGSLSNVQVIPTVFGNRRHRATVTPTADGTVTVSMGPGFARDRVGNPSLAAQPLTVQADLTAPTVAIARPNGESGPVNSAFDITITFSEGVTGFDENDLTVSNGTADNFAGSGASYTATITPTRSGEVTVDIAADAAMDAAGNSNTAAPQFSTTLDQTAPTVAIEGPPGLVNGTFPIMVKFSEGVTGFDEDDLTVGNGTASDVTDTGDGATYTAMITPTAGGEVTVDLAANKATDAAGNGNEAADQLSVTADLTAPTVEITGPTEPVEGPFPITITFSEAVTDFGEDDLTVGNGTAGNIQGTGATYTARITPAATGEVTVDIAADRATDAAGNGNEAADQFSVMADLPAPTVTIGRPEGERGPVKGAFSITITFSRVVTGFGLTDLTVGNATASNLQGTGAAYMATVTPDAGYNGPVTIDVAADVVDSGNTAATQLSVTVDQTDPTVTIRRPRGESGAVNSAFDITITFSEVVTGFTLTDLTVGNGAASDLQGTGATYTATITPTTGYSGPVTIDIAADAVEDTAGNGNEAAPQFSVTADQTAPTVTITRPSSGNGMNDNDPFGIRITFSEAVTGFDVDDLTVGNGTASNVMDTGDGAIYTATITPAIGYTGRVTVDIAANRATDVAGNGNGAAQQFSVMVTSGPTPFFIRVLPIDATSLSVFTRVFSVDITFRQFLSGHSVEMSELTVTNGTLTDLRETTPGFSWQVTVTATEGYDGPVTIAIAAGAVQDNAGRDSEPGMVMVTVDQTPPTPTITRPDGETGLVTGPFNIIIDFDEVVQGSFTSPTVNNGSLRDLQRIQFQLERYGARVTPTADGTVTVSMGPGFAQDEAGNPSLAAQPLIVQADVMAPTVAIARPDGESGLVKGAFDITITFSEAVTGFELDDLTVGNGTAGNFSADSDINYTATITPTQDGEVTVDIAANRASDGASRGNEQATQLLVIADVTAPTVEITGPSGTVTGSFDITIAFTEPVSGFGIGNLRVGNGTVGNFSGNGASYMARITPSSDDEVTVDIAAAAVMDAAGNNNEAAPQFSVMAELAAPTVAIARPMGESGPVSGDFNITITFSDSVTGFEMDDLNVGNGTVKAESFSGSGASYTATITPTNDGAVTVDITADAADDGASRGNEQATQLSVIADVTAPTVGITGPSGTMTGGFNITITFSEAVSGFDVNDLSVGNGTASNFSGSGAIYMARITPSSDGEVTVNIAAEAAVDALGNDSEAAPEFSVMADLTSPTVAIARPMGESGLVTGPFNITITFSEPVTGFTLTDLTVRNGTASNVQGTGAAYTARITPTAGYSGVLTVNIPENVAEDAVSRDNVAASQFRVMVDQAVPTVAIGRPFGESGPVSRVFDITITFSEAVTGFDENDLTVGNGTASNLTNSSGDRTRYTATITPSQEGTVTVDIPANVATDAVDNGNQAATQFSVTADLTEPTVTFAGPTGGTTVTGPFNVTVTFTEPVNGFDENSLTVTTRVGNTAVGIVGNIQGSGASYTATITPGRDGVLAVRVPAGVVTDAAGNGNDAGVTGQFRFSQLELTARLGRPTVIIGRPNGESGPVKGAFGITITFSSSVNGFELTDLTVGNGMASNFSGSGRSYRATITPTVGHNGPVTVDIAADVASSNYEATQFSVTADQTAPRVESITGPTGLVNGPFDITITFSEPVKDFVVGDLTVGNGTAGSFLGRGRTYEARITPTRDGPVTVDIAANKATDEAGNGNEAAAQFSVTADQMVPTVAIARAVGESGPVNGDFNITITFSESVTGFGVNDLRVGNGMASNVQGTGAAYTATITPTTNYDGPVTVDVPANVVLDAASRGNMAAAQFSVTADQTAPRVESITGPTGLVNGPFDITITFSEPVEDFVVGDLTVGNGTAGSFLGRGRTYEARITPTRDGPVTVDIAANKATDEAGNGNEAAAQFSVTADQMVPTVAIARAVGESGPVNGDFNITITFSESVTGFDVNDLRVGNGMASNVQGTGAAYTATITPTTNYDGPVTVDIPANVVLDAASRGNMAAAQFSVTADQTPPTVAIARTDGSSNPVNGAFDITISLSQSVNNFTAANLAVADDNGQVANSVSNFAGSGTSYMATITPAANYNGTLTVTIAADLLTDDAGNRSAQAELLVEVSQTGQGGAQVADIPDANLRRALEVELGKNTGELILVRDLDRPDLTTLRLNGRGIANLMGLEHAINLQVLTLAGNPIEPVENFSPLTNLTSLTTLNLANTGISNLNVLSNLENLVTLKLQRNNITSLTGLPILREIKRLRLNDNSIEDISLLVRDEMGWDENDLIDLRGNSLGGNPLNTQAAARAYDDDIPALRRRISDSGVLVDPDPRSSVNIPNPNLRRVVEEELGISPGAMIETSALQGLRGLNANGQGIDDLTGLEDATGLNTLTLAGNRIEDFSPLMNLDSSTESEEERLRILNLASTSISDLSVLSNLDALVTLKLQRNNITSLEELPILGQINRLKLNDNEIEDIDLLTRSGMGWGANDHLDLRGNPLNTAAYTTHIPRLLSLITDGDVLFDPLPASANLIPDPNLRRVVAEELGVSPGLIQASNLQGLTELRGNGQGIADLTGIEQATGLNALALAGNPIGNFSPLMNLDSSTESEQGRLRALNLANTSISDLNVLSNLTGLRVVKLQRNNITSLTELPILGEIRRLKLDDNNINDITPLVRPGMGWGSGDHLDLRGNPLSSPTVDGNITTLRGLGVTVLVDPRPSTSRLVTGTTTQGDVAISIAALEPSVTEGEPAQFQLTAAPAPTTDLVVTIAVADPHGVLIHTPPTQVTIEADQTTLTLELETDDDDIDELNATVTVTLEESPDARYTVAAAPDNSASITIMDNDGLTRERRERGIEYALGAFGRAAGWDLVEAIRNRSRSSIVQAQAFEITNLPAFSIINMGTPGTSIEMSSIDLDRLLDSEIKIAFNPQVAQASGSSGKLPLVRAWINASRTDVESNPFEGRTQEGELTIGRFGIDAAYSGGWLVGSVFSWHDGNIEFDDTDFNTSGEVGIDLLSINPYVSYTKNKLHLWGTIGGGFGDLSYEDSPGGRTTSTDSDLRMLTAAAGAEYEFGRFGPFDLKGRGEGMVVNLDAEDSSHVLVGYDDIGVTVYGARGELELGLPLQLDNNQTELRPYVFTGLRQDGGLGNDLVLEYGGGFALSTGSLVAEGTIRSQSSSEDDAVELKGYSISLAYDRGNDRRGLVAGFERSAGPSSDYDPYGGGALSSFSPREAGTETRLHLGYGIGWDEQLLRPFVAMDWQESQESDLDLGLEYQYSDGSASLGYGDGEFNLRFRFQKLF